MPSRHFKRELAQQLPRWKEKGWLAPDGAEAIAREYDLNRPAVSLAPLISSLFATCLLLGGLILMLAHNWDELPRTLRLVLALLPTVIITGLGAWRLLRDTLPGPAFSQGIALASSLSVALSISLVAQVYNISGDFPRFILTWALLSLPAALLLEASLTWILFQILSVVWLFNMDSGWALPGYLGLLLISLVPIQLPGLWSRPGLATRPFALTSLLVCISFALGKVLIPLHHEAWGLIAFGAWFACLSTSFIASEIHGARALRLLSNIGLSVILLSLSFEHTWSNLTLGIADGWHHTPGWYGPALALVTVLGLTAALLRRRRLLDTTAWAWGLAGLAALAAALLHQVGLDATAGMLLANLLILALALETMRKGVLGNDTLRTNLGMLLLSLLILLRFFDTHVSYLLRGLAFIGLGLGFLALNAWLRKRRQPDA